MKCKVCGAESGKYPLCRVCNIKKEKGEIIKCAQCGNWHYVTSPCTPNASFSADAPDASFTSNDQYVYDLKKTLISKSEQAFYDAIKGSVPPGYHVFPQINLASFIEKTDDSRFHNELFRIVDFLITDFEYHPKFIIEINDQSHLNPERKERDEKVKKICEEAGIPIINLWTSYGVNVEYIKNKINETLGNLPAARIHHFDPSSKQTKQDSIPNQSEPSQVSYIPRYHRRRRRRRGCYIATCVYGSYDCPEVWMLRRFRDQTLASSWYGTAFIQLYYAISPSLVKWFGTKRWFRTLCKTPLDHITASLRKNGFEDTPYSDQ